MATSKRFNKANIDHLTKSLERLSIYDGQGKVHILQISPKADYAKILGDLDIDTIEDKIKELQEYEKQCSISGDLEEAENATNQINELLEKEILLENLGIIEKNQREFEELKNMNDMQILEFNEKWDDIILVLTNSSKKIEGEILMQHSREREKLDEEMEKIDTPPAKLSSVLLNNKVKLWHLIKGKRYAQARILKADIEEMEERETELWEIKFHEKLMRKKELLLKKQKNEYEALKTRLEKSINTKLKQRMTEYEKLLQRIQNMQNELIIKQNRNFSRVQAINAKILAKYSLNLIDLEKKAFEGEQQTRVRKDKRARRQKYVEENEEEDLAFEYQRTQKEAITTNGNEKESVSAEEDKKEGSENNSESGDGDSDDSESGSDSGSGSGSDSGSGSGSDSGSDSEDEE